MSSKVPDDKPSEPKKPEPKQPDSPKPPEAKQPEPTKPPEAKQPEPAKPPEAKQPKPAKPPKAKQPEPDRTPEAAKPQSMDAEDTLIMLFGKAVDRKALEDKPKEELVEIILDLNSQLVKTTSQLGERIAPPLPTLDIEVGQYVRVPASAPEKRPGQPDTTWRIVLIGPNPGDKPLGLEVCDPVIIGRQEGDVTPHVDLTKHDALELGVSRRHALLRPTESNLYLIDLRSTNGTFRNSARLDPGVPQELRNGDTIAFGQLRFKVRIVSQPKKSAA